MDVLEVATVVSAELLRAPEITTPDERFDRAWARVAGASMLDVFRAKRLWDLAIEASELEGDFVECGAHRGGTACLLGLLVHELGLDKRVHVLDSFAGMPPADPRYDEPHFVEGMLASDLEQCRALIRSLELDQTMVVLPGWFEDTLPRMAEADPLALVHVDCDLYSSTKVCLDALVPRAAPGAPVIFDDYLIQSPGERIAALELALRSGDTLQLGPSTQAYLRKGARRAPSVSVVGPQGETLGCDELLADDAYLEWLEGVAARLHRNAAVVAELALALR